MPTFPDTNGLLMAQLLTQIDTALGATTLSNANVMLGTVYEEQAPEEVRGLCYAIVSIADTFPSPATDRVRTHADHLVTVSVWAPDMRSPKEAAGTIKERLTAKTRGVVQNVSLTGFVVTDVRLQYQNTVATSQAPRGLREARTYGQTLGLRVVAYPTS